MTDIVTLDEVKLYLRVDHTDEDTTIAILIGAATEAVTGIADGWTAAGATPDRLKLAVMAHVANAFTYRENGADLPASAARLIAPYRVLDL